MALIVRNNSIYMVRGSDEGFESILLNLEEPYILPPLPRDGKVNSFLQFCIKASPYADNAEAVINKYMNLRTIVPWYEDLEGVWVQDFTENGYNKFVSQEIIKLEDEDLESITQEKQVFLSPQYGYITLIRTAEDVLKWVRYNFRLVVPINYSDTIDLAIKTYHYDQHIIWIPEDLDLETQRINSNILFKQKVGWSGDFVIQTTLGGR